MATTGVSMPIEAYLASPTIMWNHTDGPLLEWAGRMHWLTFQERLQLWLRWTDIESLAQKHWPARRHWFPEKINRSGAEFLP